MRSYSAKKTINAPAQKIWEILTDPAGYSNWDPGMVRVEGRLALGEKVKFFTKFSPEQAFAVKVTGFEPGKKMVLTGGMPFGLFKSERTHTLTPDENGQIVFHTEEIFSGLLLPIFGRTIPDLTNSFEAFAAGLKQKAENS
ncbi:SRPBCC family protein [Candidatus Leptofilum sp.]|uniref:SRPBCC family protein n=1 Tax=Candidatus Leptofilum sp. TaxID=3241576 RepID=UPI003B59A31A